MSFTPSASRMTASSVLLRWLAVVASSFALSACGGSGSSNSGTPSPPAPTTYTLGGTVSGATADGLVLANGSATVTVSSGATTFSFTSSIATGTAYAVTVQTAPAGLTCSVANGAGTIGTANVNDVAVTCAVSFYTLGGSIAGLTSSGLVLTDGTDQLSVAANAIVFSMPTPLAYNSAYTVSVATQPVGQLCSVANATGRMPGANVNSVQVACSEWTWEGGSSSLGAGGTYGTLGTAAAGNVPGARDSQMSWTDSAGRFWMFGGAGVGAAGTSGSGELNDMWMYDPGTQQWTWKGGLNTVNASATYGAPGVAAVANLPGGRHSGMLWTDSNGRVWLFGGIGLDSHGQEGSLNDLWWYDPTSQQWTWDGVSNTGGAVGVYGTLGVAAATNVPGARAYAATWTDSSGRLWMFGGLGVDSLNNPIYFNDLWFYDPTSHDWTWVSGSSSTNQQGVYGTQGSAAAANTPSARYGAEVWRDGAGRFWLFGGGGYGYDSTNTSAVDVLNDLWVFDPGTQQWTWMSGTDVVATPGVYGTLGSPAAGNRPGGRGAGVVWTDSAGQVWLFGGIGVGLSGGEGSLNDLWTYNPATQQWTWVNGPDTANSAAGVYGTLGTGAPGNQPGSRGAASGWTDPTGHLWMFGGEGLNSAGNPGGDMNDLWKF